VRQYYRDRYSLEERDLTPCERSSACCVPRICQNVVARTVLIERVSPVDAATERYLLDTIFKARGASVCGPIYRMTTTPNLGACVIRNIRNLRCDARISISWQSFTLVTGEVQYYAAR